MLSTLIVVLMVTSIAGERRASSGLRTSKSSKQGKLLVKASQPMQLSEGIPKHQQADRTRFVELAAALMEGGSALHRSNRTKTNRTGNDTKADEAKPEDKDAAAKDAASTTTAKPVDVATLANEAATSGKCPEDSMHVKPDEFGNCECKADFRCYDERVAGEGLELSKELSTNEAQSAARKLFEDDVIRKGPGCSKHPPSGDPNAKPKDSDGTVSLQFFMHSCKFCRCRKFGGDGAAAEKEKCSGLWCWLTSPFRSGALQMNHLALALPLVLVSLTSAQ